jgi:hypothetical protein
VAVDLNNDGRLDIVTTSLGDRPEIWENRTQGQNRWIALKLTATKGNRDAIGAEVRIGRQMRVMTTAAGYASSVHAPVHFGLGPLDRIDRIEIVWPGGTKQAIENVLINQVLAVKEP